MNDAVRLLAFFSKLSYRQQNQVLIDVARMALDRVFPEWHLLDFCPDPPPRGMNMNTPLAQQYKFSWYDRAIQEAAGEPEDGLLGAWSDEWEEEAAARFAWGYLRSAEIAGDIYASMTTQEALQQIKWWRNNILVACMEQSEPIESDQHDQGDNQDDDDEDSWVL